VLIRFRRFGGFEGLGSRTELERPAAGAGPILLVVAEDGKCLGVFAILHDKKSPPKRVFLSSWKCVIACLRAWFAKRFSVLIVALQTGHVGSLVFVLLVTSLSLCSGSEEAVLSGGVHFSKADLEKE